MLLVTGGAGFIGSNFVLSSIAQSGESIVNLDKLTYAGDARNLRALEGDARHLLVKGDIGDRALVRGLLEEHAPRAVVHFAAESHVDRSISAPAAFIETNVAGSFALLEEARLHFSRLQGAERQAFRFLNVSTDEVYGSLGPLEAAFTEARPYAPNSPYAASKAAADHLVRAYFHTYGLPTLNTHCSNNYGPRQFPEKLIPLLITRALAGEALPVYGDGENIRDWLYVDDHCAALRGVLERGQCGETYNVGGSCELRNVDVVRMLCAILDEDAPRAGSYAAQVRFVPDRPGHDRRYAIDTSKIRHELGWRPAESFRSGLRKTVRWYLDERRRPAESMRRAA